MKKTQVHLVGAGPGDPRLLTRRAYELLSRADIVVYDALVSPEILALIPERAERIPAGKRAAGHSMHQREINALLVELAEQRGGCIVRLKGGDPFVFGRGGEEMLALRSAGIPYEIVPGISSGLAAPAYFDIPITHRGLSQAFTCITAYTEDEGLPELDWTSLAKLPGTLVFYMGMRQVAKISAALLGAGMSVERPAAILSKGTSPEQQLRSETLGAFAASTEDYSALAPGLFIVGEVLSLAEGRQPKPLEGKRIIVTRAQQQASSLAEGLRAQGAEVRLLPSIEIAERTEARPQLEEALSDLSRYDWLLLTSPNAVHYFFAALECTGRDARALAGLRLAVVGPMTAETLSRHGLRADFMPSVYTAQGFAADFLAAYPEAEGRRRLLFPCSELAQHELTTALEAAGSQVERVELYSNHPIAYRPEELQRCFAGAGWLTACSSSAIDHLYSLLEAQGQTALLEGVRLAVLGPQTAAKAERLGLTTSLIAPEATIPSLVEALCKASTADQAEDLD